MKCIHIVKGTHQKRGNRLWTNYQCRKCLPCMITRRQEWTARLLLEMRITLRTYYVTLTYDDLHLPPLASLRRKDLQDFLKRLRKNTRSKLRFFACGEYGDRKGRPHYHLVIFTNSDLNVEMGLCPERRKFASIGGDFHKAWSLDSIPFGLVDVVSGLGNNDSKRVFAYVAGYVLKKLGKEKCLPGKEPEFQVMSTKPGLGVGYVQKLISNLKRQNIKPRLYDGVAVESDLQMLRIDGKLYPLSRTIREKILEAFDGEPSELQKALSQDTKAKREFILEDTEEYQALRDENAAKAKQIFKKYIRARID